MSAIISQTICISCSSYLAELPRLLTEAPSATLLSRVSSRSEGSESERRDVVLGGDRWSVGVRAMSTSSTACVKFADVNKLIKCSYCLTFFRRKNFVKIKSVCLSI